MSHESKYDAIMDRFNMAIPVLGLIFLYLYWKKQRKIEDAEDAEYCEMMRSMGKEPSFPHASVGRLKYKIYGRLVANLIGSIITCILFVNIFWLYSLVIGVAIVSFFDLVLAAIAVRIWDSKQPSIDEIYDSNKD